MEADADAEVDAEAAEAEAGLRVGDGADGGRLRAAEEGRRLDSSTCEPELVVV